MSVMKIHVTPMHGVQTLKALMIVHAMTTLKAMVSTALVNASMDFSCPLITELSVVSSCLGPCYSKELLGVCS